MTADTATADPSWTRIKIETPLPMGVAGALMQLLGAAYPDAVVETNTDRYDRKMVIAVDARKPAKKVSRAEAKRLRESAEVGQDELVTDFLGFDKGWVSIAPSQDLCLALGDLAHRIIASSEGAVNYLEWEVLTPDNGPRYVISIARSKGQTPHKLRAKAEAEVERLTALLDAAGINHAA